MNKPFYFERADTCPLCRSKRSVDAYNIYNKPIHLSTYLDDNHSDLDLRKKFRIQYMKCSRCKHEFYPEWHNGIPYAIIESNLDRFLEMFGEYKKVDP